MVRIHIERTRSPKQRRKATRKLKAQEAMRCARMKAAFQQLTPLDEYKVRMRARKEARRIKSKSGRLYVHTLMQELNLAYKYTQELLETVVV